MRVHSLHDGITYVRQHPQLVVTLLLLVVVPVTFLMSGQQFLKAAKSNQERLEHDRIGLLHDSFISVIRSSGRNSVVIQEEITHLAELNDDIVVFRVSKKTDEGFVPIAALEEEVIGTLEETSVPYNFAYTQPNDSLIETLFIEGERFLRGVRLVSGEEGDLVILTVTSRKNIDALFESRIQAAYIWLAALLLIVMALIIRHIQLIDYAYLYRESRAAIQAKNMFTNMVAHELRTPLTAIKGYASLIREQEDVDEKTRERGSRIETASNKLVLIINDLLDVARIQSGRLAIEKREVNFSNVIIEVGKTLEVTAKEKGIALEYQAIPKDVYIDTDEKRIHQVITNLISNSIKYTPKGTITIDVEERKDRVEVRVKDTGTGISSEDQKKLFAPFFRVESEDVNTVTGTGLGMWITKLLVELMGGSIGVESIKGVGTHIVLTFPKSEV